MVKIALYIMIENVEPEEFIERLTNVVEKLGYSYIVDESWVQVMVLLGYGIAVFDIEKVFKDGKPYLNVTILPIGTLATLSSLITDIQKLLKEMGIDYKKLGFTVN